MPKHAVVVCVKCKKQRESPWLVETVNGEAREIHTYRGARIRAFYKVRPGEHVCRDCHYKLRMQ